MSKTEGNLPAVSDTQFELAMRAIMGEAVEELSSRDPEVISRAIVERILSADTFEGIFQPQSTTPWREHLQRPAIVKDVRFVPSSIATEGSPSIFAVCDVVWLDTGEVDTVSCGGRNVLAQLLAALRKGVLGENPVQLTARETRDGYRVLWLEPAPDTRENPPF